MKKKHINKYASLLIEYCTQITTKNTVLIRSTYLAEPLILACQKLILEKGGTCEVDISLPNFSKQKYTYSNQTQLKTVPSLYKTAIETFDVIISIHAPFNCFELKGIEEEKLSAHQRALKPIKMKMMERSKTNDLKWVICNFPTESLAKTAKMSLDAYTKFISDACFLNKVNPSNEWKNLSKHQEKIVKKLNTASIIHFKSPNADITFDVSNRIWINSDGKRNMPSGEVFTSPIENSGNGWIKFTYPSLLFGQEIHQLKLIVKKGKVVSWTSKKGQKLLDKLFAIDGARYFGEIAIGTNNQIKTSTLNTLFDEKIGGTIHMAVGASYPETGGKNQCSLHYDFVTEFTKNSSITIDGLEFYKNGHFFV